MSKGLKDLLEERARAQTRICQAALKWERAYTGWSTAPRDVKDTHRVTPTSEMREAEKELAEAVQAYRASAK